MLILSRKPGDAILIDGGIRVVVLACDHRGVRLGIEAPSRIGIVREEIVVQIADENRRANAAEHAPDWLGPIPPRAGAVGDADPPPPARPPLGLAPAEPAHPVEPADPAD